MRFIIQLFLLVILCYVSQFIMPWWGVMVGAFLASIIVYTSALLSFFAGFLGLGSLWFFLAYTIDIANKSLLSGKVAILFGLNSNFHLIIITALLGSILGGLSALSGNYFIALFKKKKRYLTYYK